MRTSVPSPSLGVRSLVFHILTVPLQSIHTPAPPPPPPPPPPPHAALVEYITSGPVVAIALEGKDVVAQVWRSCRPLACFL